MIDISKTKLTGTQWVEIADKLNIKINELVNQKHPDFVKIYGEQEVDLTQDHWLKVIEKHPKVIKY